MTVTNPTSARPKVFRSTKNQFKPATIARKTKAAASFAPIGISENPLLAVIPQPPPKQEQHVNQNGRQNPEDYKTKLPCAVRQIPLPGQPGDCLPHDKRSRNGESHGKRTVERLTRAHPPRTERHRFLDA